MDSILSSIKTLLNINVDCTDFDNEIIPLINSTLLPLKQLGVPSVGRISSELDTWESVFGKLEDRDAVETYIFLKVKPIFDPPTSATVMDALKQELKETEWRLNIDVESDTSEGAIV